MSGVALALGHGAPACPADHAARVSLAPDCVGWFPKGRVSCSAELVCDLPCLNTQTLISENFFSPGHVETVGHLNHGF